MKAASLKAIAEGKLIAYDQMKLIRFADCEGWKATCHFKGDNIADSVEEAKRMKIAKKEA